MTSQITLHQSPYRYEFGERWNAKTPRFDIKWLLGRTHVGTSDEEVEKDIRRRTEGQPGYTAALVRECVRYALLCHRQNQDQYRYVMLGGRR